jgi:ABC-type methionine transport system permease subunit
MTSSSALAYLIAAGLLGYLAFKKFTGDQGNMYSILIIILLVCIVVVHLLFELQEFIKQEPMVTDKIELKLQRRLYEQKS